MAYEVEFTDNINKGSLTVEDNDINNETSLVLVGKNLSDYGKVVNENFLHLLENFANSTSPNSPVEGQLWYDTTIGVDQLKIYDGAQWVSAGGIKKSSSAPNAEVSTLGDLWVDTANQQVYMYSGSGWVLIGPEYSDGTSTGSKFENIIASDNTSKPVINFYVNDTIVAIVSDSDFLPKLTLPGFTRIYAGITLASDKKYYGIVEKSEKLITSNLTEFSADVVARLDVENTFRSGIKVRNKAGIEIGESRSISLQTDNQGNAFISNRAIETDIRFRTTTSNGFITPLAIKSNGNVGIGGIINPSDALQVQGNIKASGTLDLASTSATALVVGGGSTIAGNVELGSALEVTGNVQLSSITANTDVVIQNRNIGTSTNKFNNVYATQFYGNLTGDITGSSTSSTVAGKLSSPTTFSLSGDVTSTANVVFDGQVGSLTKVFNTVIDTGFITNKTLTEGVSSSDEILINRPGVGLRRLTQETLVASVPVFPVGTIVPFAGISAPAGWALCTGAEYSRSIYESLYNVIGNRFGTSSNPALLFKVPDFRGRSALGHLAGATGDNRVTNDGAANTVGLVGGSDDRYITADNLPNHEHTLVGDQGTQFYGVTSTVGVSDSNTVGTNILGTSPGTGITQTQGLVDITQTTETVNGVSQEVGNKFSVVNPFVTVNYIIYHGVTL